MLSKVLNDLAGAISSVNEFFSGLKVKICLPMGVRSGPCFPAVQKADTVMDNILLEGPVAVPGNLLSPPYRGLLKDQY